MRAAHRVLRPKDLERGTALVRASAPSPSWHRPTLTEIYLCHAPWGSDHESEGGNGARQVPHVEWCLFSQARDDHDNAGRRAVSILESVRID
jgi:hypothetical protein